MNEQKITALCLLDLFATFDTLDHYILVHRLSSWFVLTGLFFLGFNPVSLHAISLSILFVFITSLSPFPQGSILGLLLFLLYSTPLSSVICDSSVKHHLYADDTHLFIAFSAPDFS